MTPPMVVISGAGIAGPTLAFCLTKNGYRVTIVELAEGIRPGGQTVDLRGAGADVVKRMGLMDQMKGWSLFQRGIAYMRSDGSRRAEMPVEAFNGNGAVSKLEILRGDLVDVLSQATKDTADYRFNTPHREPGPRRRWRRRHAVRRLADAGGFGRRRRRAAFCGNGIDLAGNGRFVRNVIEAAEEEREFRLSESFGANLQDLEESELMRIELSDMRAALKQVLGMVTPS